MVTITLPASAARNQPAAMAVVSALVHAIALEIPFEPSALLELDGRHWALDADGDWVGRIEGDRLTLAARNGAYRLDEWLVAAAAWVQLRRLFRRRGAVFLA